MACCMARPITRTGSPGSVSGSLRTSSSTVAARPAVARTTSGISRDMRHRLPHLVNGDTRCGEIHPEVRPVEVPVATSRVTGGTREFNYHGCMADQRGRVLLADPRGYCAGVDRAVVAVERALEIHGAPVYVRKQIVHNKHVRSEEHTSELQSRQYLV